MEGNNITLLIFQIIIILSLFLVIFRLIKLTKIMRLEKRLSRFTLNSIIDDNLSFFDEAEIAYLNFRKKISAHLKKVKLINKYSVRYEKYVDKNKIVEEEAIDYVSTKVMSSLLVLFIVLVSDVFWYKQITLFQFSYSILIGFFIPNLFLVTAKRKWEQQMEDDLLKAITIMNNAFKSGNSIMQAIKIASDEIDGPISGEFKKMYVDLSYGLALDVVFKRFSKRIDLEEVKYMTTSLTILNNTGGNIVKVFSSIEKSFFLRRKMKQEMKALSATADFMYKILIVIPFAISGLVILINPDYFMPLFTTSIGIIVFTLIMVLYVIYIIIIRKIMKVEGV